VKYLRNISCCFEILKQRLCVFLTVFVNTSSKIPPLFVIWSPNLLRNVEEWWHWRKYMLMMLCCLLNHN
jgi:hypothetical protein